MFIPIKTTNKFDTVVSQVLVVALVAVPVLCLGVFLFIRVGA